MYQNNPDGITWRVKQVLAKAPETAPEPIALPVETAETAQANGSQRSVPNIIGDAVKTSAALRQVLARQPVRDARVAAGPTQP